MTNVKEGDRVRVAIREQTDEDVKSQMYFPHYGGLVGSVQKVYDKSEVAVEVEMESLTKEIRKRHEDVRDQMKTKWLDGLSEEGRSRLTEREKDFNLRYVILVSSADLDRAGARPVQAAKPAEPAAVSTASSAAPAEDDVEEVHDAAAESVPQRKTLAEIEAAEEAELLRRSKRDS